MDNLKDRQLAKEVQEGDDRAFEFLMDRYQDKILRYGQKFLSNNQDIEDVVQEVFMRAYQNINSFDSRRKFSPWLYRIAHNQFINQLKKKDREPIRFFDPEVIFPFYPSKRETDAQVKKEEITDELEKNLDKLKSKYREVIVLYYYQDLSYKEISDILKVPISTVGVRLNRAKENLKKHYEEK